MDSGNDFLSVEPRPALEIALLRGWQNLLAFGLTPSGQPNVFAFFKLLDGAVAALRAADVFDYEVEDIRRHVDYLANKAGCPTALLLGGEPFAAERGYIIDALNNISDLLEDSHARYHEVPGPPEGIPPAVFGLIRAAEVTLQGWCSRQKALYIARTILEDCPQICVQIGVFGGRSLVPCAAALRHNGSGVIYGIETWQPNVPTDPATDNEQVGWWSPLYFAHLKRAFYRFASDADLTHQMRLIEVPSHRAVKLFDRIDLLLIDRSRPIADATQDVELYASKVRPGGTIIFDDMDRVSVGPAIETLLTMCEEVMVLEDPAANPANCLVLRRL